MQINAGTGMKVPDQARAALGGHMNEPAPPPQRVNVARRQEREEHTMPPIATQCFMLSNMFDPINEREPAWDQEIRDDVVEECNKHGGVVHIYVDKASPQGNVYVKCPNIACAVAAVNALHGRWFAGKYPVLLLLVIIALHSYFVIRKSDHSSICSSGQLSQPFPWLSQPHHSHPAQEMNFELSKQSCWSTPVYVLKVDTIKCCRVIWIFFLLVK